MQLVRRIALRILRSEVCGSPPRLRGRDGAMADWDRRGDTALFIGYRAASRAHTPYTLVTAGPVGPVASMPREAHARDHLLKNVDISRRYTELIQFIAA